MISLLYIILYILYVNSIDIKSYTLRKKLLLAIFLILISFISYASTNSWLVLKNNIKYIKFDADFIEFMLITLVPVIIMILKKDFKLIILILLCYLLFVILYVILTTKDYGYF